MADIGATVTPWMLFFQQSAVGTRASRDATFAGPADTLVELFLGATFAIAAIVATAPLLAKGIKRATTRAQFPEALEPVIAMPAPRCSAGHFRTGLLAR